ncbi:response regulator [Frateuria defendens]|uniref:response regulator n=1 Tax=Frateuria defendens TaxID=2219559 RepID=UPI00066FCFE9|nr:response regulator [Frateuria defendens]
MEVVLLVEDDPDVMEVTSLLLEDAGYQLVHASDAEQALDVLAARPDIDVVFTDVNLRRGMNGIEMANAMRARGSRASVVVVSGDLGWADTPLDPSMVFLPKPYDRRTLLGTVAGACGRARQVVS